MATRKNPYVGPGQPDLFSDEYTRQFIPMTPALLRRLKVPVEDMGESERISLLDYFAYSSDEWVELPKDIKEKIVKETAERIALDPNDENDIRKFFALPEALDEPVLVEMATRVDPRDWSVALLEAADERGMFDELISANAKLEADVEEVAEKVEEQLNAQLEPGDDYFLEEAPEAFAGYHEEEQLAENFKRVFSDEYEEMLDDFGVSEEELIEELGSVLSDADLYDGSWVTLGHYGGSYVAYAYVSYPGGYIDRSGLRDWFSKFDTTNIRVAPYMVDILKAAEGHLSYPAKDHWDDVIDAWQKDTDFESYDDETMVVGADPDPDRVREEVVERLNLDERDDLVGDRLALVPTGPIESRVVFEADHPDFPGVYMVQLRPDELADEGARPGQLDAQGEAGLNHCVGNEAQGHVAAAERGRVLIYSVRRPPSKRKQMRMFTIEVSVTPSGKIIQIKQVKGRANRRPGFQNVGTESQWGYSSYEPKKKLGEVDLLRQIIEEYFQVDPASVPDMRGGLRLLAEKQ